MRSVRLARAAFFVIATALLWGAERSGEILLFGNALSANIVVNWNDVRQRIDGFGASCYATSDPDFVIANADLAFDRNKGVGLSLHRMTFPWNADGGGDFRPYKCPEIAQLAQARGATNWASPWYPPPQWKTTGMIGGGGFLKPEHYQDYATLLADSVLEMKTRYGVDVAAVSVQNEPDNDPHWGSCLWTADQIHAFVSILGNTFAQRGVASKIMLPEAMEWRFTLADKTMQDQATARFVGIIGGHPYGMPNGWVSPYKGVRPVWQTEYLVAPDGANDIGTALRLALNVHNFMTLAEVNAWHEFNLDGIMKGKRIYTLGNFSKFIRPGYSRVAVSGDSGFAVSAYKNASTGDFAIVVVNTGSGQGTRTIGLNGFSATSVTPWVTSTTQNLAPQSSVAVTDNVFTATIAAGSVTTFVGRATTSTTTPTPPSAPTNLRLIR